MFGVAEISHPLLRNLHDAREEWLVIQFLDRQHRVVGVASYTDFCPDRATIPFRAIVTEALKHEAVALIVAHNHPSGIAAPSAADRDFTRTMAKIAAALEMPLFDHLICAGGDCFSFREAGLL